MSEITKETGFIKSFDGTPIYYETRGSGRPIVMCYGLACPMNHWIHQTQYFSQKFRTILFDYRGHHLTPSPEDMSRVSIDALAMDIQAIMNHLNINKASFWGHSFGAQMLLRTYEMFPQLFDSLVLVNAFATGPSQKIGSTSILGSLFEFFKRGHKVQPLWTQNIWQRAVTNPLAIPVSALFGGFNLNLTSLKDIEVYTRGVSTMNLDVFIQLFDEMMKYDATPHLQDIEVPTLIISGNKDGVTPFEHQEKLHQLIPDSTLIRVPYGSHCTQLDVPEYFNIRVEQFMKQTQARVRLTSSAAHAAETQSTLTIESVPLQDDEKRREKPATKRPKASNPKTKTLSQTKELPRSNKGRTTKTQKRSRPIQTRNQNGLHRP